MTDVDLEQVLIELIDTTVADEADRVAEILSIGTSEQETTVGLYRTQSGRQLGFEVSEGNIEVFTLKN